jgi:ABC-type cobalamin transport system permease subunit
VAAAIVTSSKSQYVVPSYRKSRTIAAALVAAHLTTTSAILVPAATPVSTVPTLLGAVYDESAVAMLTAPTLGVTANAGDVAIAAPT